MQIGSSKKSYQIEKWAMSLEEYYQACIDKDEEKKKTFEVFVEKLDGLQKKTLRDELVNLSITKKNEDFFNYWIEILKFDNLMSHEEFQFFKILEKAPNLLTSKYQKERFMGIHWINQARHLSYLIYPDNQGEIEAETKCEKIKLLLKHGGEFNINILNEILINTMKSPHIKIIKLLEENMDFYSLKTQTSLFDSFHFFADIDFEFAGPQHKSEFARQKFIMEILNYLIQKSDLLKAQDKTTRQLLWELSSDKDCMESWPVKYEEYILKKETKNHNINKTPKL